MVRSMRFELHGIFDENSAETECTEVGMEIDFVPQNLVGHCLKKGTGRRSETFMNRLSTGCVVIGVPNEHGELIQGALTTTNRLQETQEEALGADLTMGSHAESCSPCDWFQRTHHGLQSGGRS